MPIPDHLRPEEEYRLWIDGSYKDGFIGYGIVTMPGRKLIYGGCAGTSAAEAERLAAEKAVATIPQGKSCVIYCDFLPVVKWLITLTEQSPQEYRIRGQYMNDNDPRHREAHDLANRGRNEAENAKKKAKARPLK